MQLYDRNSICFADVTITNIAGCNIQFASVSINSGRTPDATACTIIWHNIKDVLYLPITGIHLHKLSMSIGAIAKRGYPFIDTPMIDKRRTPDEVFRHFAKHDTPDNFPIERIERIKIAIATGNKYG